MSSANRPKRVWKRVSSSKRSLDDIQMANKSRVYDANPKILEEFSAPEISQHESTFLTIAVELRLDILRNLLKGDGILIGSSQQRHRNLLGRGASPEDTIQKDISQSTGIWPQVLACCQQLCMEGRYILYKENVVGLTVSPKMYGQECLSILDRALRLPASIAAMDSESQTLFSFVKDEPLNKPISQQNYNYTSARSRKYLKRLRRPSESITPISHKYSPVEFLAALCHFDELSIRLRVEDQEVFYVACRYLRDLVHDKKVTLSVVIDNSTLVPASWLKSCRILKCKRIEFLGQNGSSVDATKQLIESSKTVKDRFEVVAGCLASFQKIRQFNKSRMAMPKMHKYGNLLVSAAFDHSKKRIAKYLPLFTEAAQQGVEDWAYSQIRKLEHKVAELKRQIDDVEEAKDDAMKSVKKVKL